MADHFSSDYSLFMAMFDFVPVFLFFFGGFILLKKTYKKVSFQSFSLMASGVVMVFLSGFLKSLWKVLVSLSVTDFMVFNTSFFLVQSFGFLFLFIGLFSLFKKNKAYSFLLLTPSALPLKKYTGTFPFLILQTLSCTGVEVLLFIFALKSKNRKSMILLIVSFIFMMSMGALAALDGKMDVTLWNWLEEIVNTISQGALFLSVYFMKDDLEKI